MPSYGKWNDDEKTYLIQLRQKFPNEKWSELSRRYNIVHLERPRTEDAVIKKCKALLESAAGVALDPHLGGANPSTPPESPPSEEVPIPSSSILAEPSPISEEAALNDLITLMELPVTQMPSRKAISFDSSIRIEFPQAVRDEGWFLKNDNIGASMSSNLFSEGYMNCVPYNSTLQQVGPCSMNDVYPSDWSPKFQGHSEESTLSQNIEMVGGNSNLQPRAFQAWSNIDLASLNLDSATENLLGLEEPSSLEYADETGEILPVNIFMCHEEQNRLGSSQGNGPADMLTWIKAPARNTRGDQSSNWDFLKEFYQHVDEAEKAKEVSQKKLEQEIARHACCQQALSAERHQHFLCKEALASERYEHQACRNALQIEHSQREELQSAFDTTYDVAQRNGRLVDELTKANNSLQAQSEEMKREIERLQGAYRWYHEELQRVKQPIDTNPAAAKDNEKGLIKSESPQSVASLGELRRNQGERDSSSPCI
ncbi:MAG: hypothetical protein M1834_008500 [Cirrosporium novae-zelandiae]|nr:MAG: hypothetical protein M1834_008500 [Cirrosporium novae-zelandiae]